MKTYEITFTGKKAGAIGKSGKFRTQVFAENPEAAKLALYDRFDHISLPQIKEIPSPHGSDDLVLYVQNDSRFHKLFRLYVERLRDCLDSVAKDVTKANQAWHDDPECCDHQLYQAPPDHQFPRKDQDAAILELVARHIEVINENEAAAAEKAGVL